MEVRDLPYIPKSLTREKKMNDLVMGWGTTYVWVIRVPKPGVMEHTLHSSTGEAEEGGSLSSRPALSTEGIPGQPEPRLH